MASSLDAMSSTRSRRRRFAKLRRQRSNAPRALAAALFFFLLCYEMVVLRPPVVPKPPVSGRGAAPPSPPAPVAAVPPTHPPRPTQSSSMPSESAVGSHQASPNPHIVAKAAVSPSSISTRLAELQKISSYTSPPSTSHSLRAVADGEQASPSPSFHPLRKRNSHTSHPVSSSLAQMEKLAADRGDDQDDAKSKPRSPSEQSDRMLSKSEHRANPGAGENFWQWFQETKETEGTTNVSCPPDRERVCLMFYKFIKKYKIRSVYDVSCAQNLEWVPDVVRKAGKELWGFKYYCNAPDAKDLERAKEKLSGLSYVQFAPDLWWRTGFAEDTQLLFAWDLLPHIAYGRIWSFFVKSKAQNIKYLLFDNYPGIMNDPSPKRQYLNIRKHPFRFPAAKEVVQNVTEPGETEKRQLLFYETDMLPDNLQ